MTYDDLKRKVEKEIANVKTRLADSPVSAENHLQRGIGFVEAVGQYEKYDIMPLLQLLDATINDVRKTARNTR